MSLKKKILAAGLAVCMAAIMVTGMTLAYFTDTADRVNTFTVGKVKIELTEPNWDADLNNKDLIPGKDIPKDPTITVATGSQMAYTFMKVQLSSDFMELLNSYVTEKQKTVTGYSLANAVNDWFYSAVQPKIMAVGSDYVILGVLSPKKAGDSVTYFDKVTVPEDVTQAMIKENGNYTITVTAYAIQAEGFYTGESEAEKQASRQAAFEALFPGETIIP